MVDKLEDARAVLVAELRKIGFDTHADNVAAGHGVMIPSYVALDLIAASRTPANGEQVERAAKAMAEADGVGPWERMSEQAPRGWGETACKSYWRKMATLAAATLSTPTEDARSRVKVLEEALEWYAEQTRGCRKIGRDGDAFRQALDRDGGQLARTALGNKETDRHG